MKHHINSNNAKHWTQS